MNNSNKKLLKNIGKTSRFCECGRLYTFKIRSHNFDRDYDIYDKCHSCRGLQSRKAEQRLFCVYKIKTKTISNKPNKKRVQRRDVEIEKGQRVRKELKVDARGLHLF